MNTLLLILALLLGFNFFMWFYVFIREEINDRYEKIEELKSMEVKKIYKFTLDLKLKNLDIDINELEDKLFKAGCDDSILSYTHDSAYLYFTRESSSFAEAISSAIKNVKSISIEPELEPDCYLRYIKHE